MKITGLDTFVVDAGWRPWQFVAVRTDAGITGYGECSDGRNPYGVVATVSDFSAILVGKDPRPVEMRYQDMYRMARQSAGGIAAKAIAGIELALWDIKAKAFGVPVYELFGGPVRERQQVYWSHCGTSRARSAELIDHPPVIERGELVIPTRPGWGTDLNEDVARKHVWERGRPPAYADATPR